MFLAARMKRGIKDTIIPLVKSMRSSSIEKFHSLTFPVQRATNLFDSHLNESSDYPMNTKEQNGLGAEDSLGHWICSEMI